MRVRVSNLSECHSSVLDWEAVDVGEVDEDEAGSGTEDAADVVLDVLDARDPAASRSAHLEEVVRGLDKKMLLVLNKVGEYPAVLPCCPCGYHIRVRCDFLTRGGGVQTRARERLPRRGLLR